MISHLYPTSTPALNLNFKSSRVADPRISCTRSTTATYVDPVSKLVKTAGANEARVSKDGLVVEESRTNLITNSQVFQTGYYLGNITTADNVAVAPDGTTTAASMLETAVNDFHVIGLTGTSQSNLSQSFFVKPNGRDNICVRFVNSSGDWRTITFNLTGNGSITQDFPSSLSTWTINSKSITPLSNGWYRISVGATTSSTTPNIFSVMCCDSPTPTLVTAWGFPRYTGDVTKGYYVWGAQAEANSFPTSYIPTSGSTVTRAADVCEITGTNFSSWWNTSAGTVLTNWYVYNEGVTYQITNNWDKAVQAEVFTSYTQDTLVGHLIPTYQENSSNSGLQVDAKNAFAFTAGDAGAALNGILKTGTAATPTIPSPLLRTVFFSRWNGTLPCSGYLKNFTYYPTRVPDTALEALTQ